MLLCIKSFKKKNYYTKFQAPLKDFKINKLNAQIFYTVMNKRLIIYVFFFSNFINFTLHKLTSLK